MEFAKNIIHFSGRHENHSAGIIPKFHSTLEEKFWSFSTHIPLCAAHIVTAGGTRGANNWTLDSSREREGLVIKILSLRRKRN
jgi:hypothetical protein